MTRRWPPARPRFIGHVPIVSRQKSLAIVVPRIRRLMNITSPMRPFRRPRTSIASHPDVKSPKLEENSVEDMGSLGKKKRSCDLSSPVQVPVTIGYMSATDDCADDVLLT